MKKVFCFFAAAAIGLPLMLSSCAKEDPAKPLEVNLSKTGTFKTTILAVTNTTVTPQTYAAAPITKENIVATVLLRQLNPGLGASNTSTYLVPNSDIDYNASTGVLEIKVPTVDAGVTLTVSIISASGRRMQGSPAAEVVGIWSYGGSAITPTIYPGATVQQAHKVMDFTEGKGPGSNV